MDVGEPDLGASLGAFRVALKQAASGSAIEDGMGLYGLAMAAGRPGLGGFAPLAGVAGRRPARTLMAAGEAAGHAPVRSSAVRLDGGAYPVAAGEGAETGYRMVVARARTEATAMSARRAAERAAWRLPGRDVAPAGRSFAPQPGPALREIVSLEANRQGEAPQTAARLRDRLVRGAQAAGAPFALPPGAAATGEPFFSRDAQMMPGVFGTGGDDGHHGGVTAGEAGLGPRRGAVAQPFTAGAERTAALGAPREFEQALENYFFRQSRLAPAGGAGFNPLLSPVWAGLKIPG